MISIWRHYYSGNFILLSLNQNEIILFKNKFLDFAVNTHALQIVSQFEHLGGLD